MSPFGRMVPNNPAVSSGPIGGYSVWYDASQITGVADGASLSSWADLSGNGWDLEQASGGAQPTYYKTTADKLINGLPAVWFNGSSDNMEITADGFDIPQPLTVIGVWESLGSSSIPWSGGDGQVYASMGVGADGYALNGSTGTDIFGGTGDNDLHIMGWLLDDGGTSEIIVDNTVVASGVVGTRDLSGFVLGSYPTSIEFLEGPVGELLIYPSALDPTDLTSDYNYLNAKWF